MELVFVAFARSQGTLLHHAGASRHSSVEDPLDPGRLELAPAYLETHLGSKQRSHQRSRGSEPYLMGPVTWRTWEAESLHSLFGTDFPEKGDLPRSDQMCLGYSLVLDTTPHVQAAETPRWVVAPAVHRMEPHNHLDSRAPRLVNTQSGVLTMIAREAERDLRVEESSTPTRSSDYCCS